MNRDRARRVIPPVLAWIAVTGVATAVSTAGVSMISSEVTDSHSTLSASRVDELVEEPREADALPATPVTTSAAVVARPPSPPARPVPTTTIPAAAATAEPRVRERPPPPPQSATFATEGGVMSVTCRGPEISLDSARPNDGYQLIVRDDGPERVVVEFVGERSRHFLGSGCRAGQPVRFERRARDEPERTPDDGSRR